MDIYSAFHRIFGVQAVSITSEVLDGESGFSSRIASEVPSILRYTAQTADGSRIEFAGKSKTSRVIVNGVRVFGRNNPALLAGLALNHRIFGYNGSIVREALVCRGLESRFRDSIPHIYGSVHSAFGTSGFVAMKEFESSDDDSALVYPVLDFLADLHAEYFGKKECICRLGLNHYSEGIYKRSRRCLGLMFRKLEAENLKLLGSEKISLVTEFIENIHNEYRKYSGRMTLTHNDCSVRNLIHYGDRFCLYDWELACYQNPEHDTVEYLISVLDRLSDSEVNDALDYYKNRFEALSGTHINSDEYCSVLMYNTLEYCVNKLSLLRLADLELKTGYISLLVSNTSRMTDIIRERQSHLMNS